MELKIESFITIGNAACRNLCSDSEKLDKPHVQGQPSAEVRVRHQRDRHFARGFLAVSNAPDQSSGDSPEGKRPLPDAGCQVGQPLRTGSLLLFQRVAPLYQAMH